MDAYSSLHQGRLGKDFSVLKMKKSPLLAREDSDGRPKPAVCVYALILPDLPCFSHFQRLGSTQGTKEPTPRLAREYVL